MPRRKKSVDSGLSWTQESVKEHIENGKLLYRQLSEEAKREIEDDTEGSARKAALQAKADAWRTANVLITEIAKLQERYDMSEKEGSILTEAEKKQDFSEGFAEQFAK